MSDLSNRIRIRIRTYQILLNSWVQYHNLVMYPELEFDSVRLDTIAILLLTVNKVSWIILHNCMGVCG